MRIISLFFIGTFISFNSLAQSDEKVQSLLWEISKEGLKNPSYLYGTMHVSDRVSYHLSDAFFEHLMGADIVATESHFEEWADLEELLSVPEDFFQKPFYSTFYKSPIKRYDILSHFRGITYSTNNLLFRTSPQVQDYQEETYLDMFIFQAGKKNNKRIVGLECAKESFAMIANLDFEDFTVPSEEKMQELFKLLRGRNPDEAIADFYREKNLSLILRFMELMMPHSWLDAMLFKRNVVMAKSIDSLAREGSLFASMGAAHLPGEQGVIQLLKDMGYTVKPVLGDYTDQGRKIKKQIDELFLEPIPDQYSTDDSMMALPLFGHLQYSGRNVSSPDLANGGAINLFRTPLNDFLVEREKRFNHLTLDSLFFENIPGQIEKKEFVEENHHYYYDIQNTTSAGNTQRYRFYVTPLELITVSMVGTGNYTRLYHQQIFSNIRLKLPENDWQRVVPNKKGFSVMMPSYHFVYGDRPNPVYPEKIEMQGYDPSTKSFYFFIENSPENLYHEDTAYELERIQKEFYMQHDVLEYSTLGQTINSFVSQGVMYEKDIFLKTVIHGNNYYLLGCVACNLEQRTKYFDSFEITGLLKDTGFQTYSDLNHLFDIDLPHRQNELRFLTNTIKERSKPKEKDQWFESKRNEFTFTSVNGSQVELYVYQYHPYESEVAVDSVFTRLRRRYIKDSEDKPVTDDQESSDLEFQFLEHHDLDEDVSSELMEIMGWESPYQSGHNHYTALRAGPAISRWNYELGLNDERNYELVNEKTYQNEQANYHVYEATVRRQESQLEFKYKSVFRDGIRYTLKAGLPINYQKDNHFVERLFDSFEPADTLLQYSVFENKLQLFLGHVQSDNDSIRSSALNSLKHLKLDLSYLEEVKELLQTLEITNKDVEYLLELLKKIAALDNPRVVELLEEIYRRENVNTSLKTAILTGMARKNSTEAYQLIIELLDYYLPIPESRAEIDMLFKEFQENLEYSSAIIPKVFEYFVVEEYKNPILGFCRKLVDSDYFEPEKLESFKHMLLSNANLEFRRTRSWLNNRKSKEEITFGFPAVTATRSLNTYLHLIHPFIDEPQFKAWWENVKGLQIPETLLEMLNIELNKRMLDHQFANQLLQRIETQFASTVMLQSKAPGFEFPEYSDFEIGTSAVVLIDNVDLEKRNLDFFREQTVKHGDKEIKFWFYRCKDKETPTGEVEETILMSIGFVIDDNGRIIPGAFYSGLQNVIQDEDDIDHYCQQIIDASLNREKSRASHGKDLSLDSLFHHLDLF